VVCVRVDAVDTDSVHAQLTEVGQVTRAVCGRREGVDVRRRLGEATTGSVSETASKRSPFTRLVNSLCVVALGRRRELALGLVGNTLVKREHAN
jgi:hypothetical protein